MAYPDSHRTPIWGQVTAVVFLIGAVLFLLWRFLPEPFQRGPLNDPDAKPRPVTPAGEMTPEELDRIQLFRGAKDSVVNVDTLLLQQNFLQVIEQEQGTGSGVIWDEKGHIVTNFHVIRDAVVRDGLDIRVVLADQSRWNARLVGAAPDYDLAVLKIDASSSKLKPIPVGSSSDLQVGQNAYAIGNPFGADLSLTAGIISALDRRIRSPTDRPITGAIQTDAALNPGNSGGPLLDRSGRLIGINTAIASPSGGNVGIGYAIPVDTVNEVVPKLIRDGAVPRPSLGIFPLRDEYTRDLGYPQGVFVQDVRLDSPADKAGIRGFIQHPVTRKWQLGDLILEIEGQPINQLEDLTALLSKCRVGQTVTVTILRNDQRMQVQVTLEGA